MESSSPLYSVQRSMVALARRDCGQETTTSQVSRCIELGAELLSQRQQHDSISAPPPVSSGHLIFWGGITTGLCNLIGGASVGITGANAAVADAADGQLFIKSECNEVSSWRHCEWLTLFSALPLVALPSQFSLLRWVVGKSLFAALQPAHSACPLSLLLRRQIFSSIIPMFGLIVALLMVRAPQSSTLRPRNIDTEPSSPTHHRRPAQRNLHRRTQERKRTTGRPEQRSRQMSGP